MRHVKIDLGNENIKHTDNNVRVSNMPHGIVRLSDSEVQKYADLYAGGVEALPPKDFIRVYKGVNSKEYVVYHVGAAALEEHGVLRARQARGASRYTADYAVPLILRVLSQYPDDSGEYSLVLMFPPSNAMYMKDYIRIVKRAWKIGDGAGTRIINIVNVEVFMEGLGSIVNAIQGRLAPIKRDQKYLAIDIGSFTTDLVMSESNGVFIPGMAYSLENYGINSIKEELQTAIRRRFKDDFKNAAVLEDNDYLESIFTNKTVNIKGRRSESVQDIVDDVCSSLINAILTGVSQKFERHIVRIGAVLLTGGGCSSLHQVLTERIDFSQVKLADERKSLYKANVRGAHYYYESLVKAGKIAV